MGRKKYPENENFSGKKIFHRKKKILVSSLSETNFLFKNKNHKPPPPKLNGCSLRIGLHQTDIWC